MYMTDLGHCSINEKEVTDILKHSFPTVPIEVQYYLRVIFLNSAEHPDNASKEAENQ